MYDVLVTNGSTFFCFLAPENIDIAAAELSFVVDFKSLLCKQDPEEFGWTFRFGFVAIFVLVFRTHE